MFNKHHRPTQIAKTRTGESVNKSHIKMVVYKKVKTLYETLKSLKLTELIMFSRKRLLIKAFALKAVGNSIRI